MIKTVDEAEWPDYICDELAPALRLLGEKYGLQISKIDFDIKGVYTDIFLKEEIPGQAFEMLKRELPRNHGLEFGGRGFICRQHYSSVGPETTSLDAGEAKSETSVWARLKQFFG